MIKFVSAAAAAVLLCFSTMVVADPATPQPMQQGAKSVNKNLRKQPDNKGLQQASDRIEDNRERFRDKHSDRTSGVDRVKLEKVAKPERPERPEKADRPERPERAERPDTQVIADRPGNSDFGRSHRR